MPRTPMRAAAMVASGLSKVCDAVTKSRAKLRSGCPLNCAVEFFGDKWTLLIVRELLFYRARTFNQLMAMEERISTGTLTTRILQLLEDKIIIRSVSPEDRRSALYSLTERGKMLEPAMAEMVLWTADNQFLDLPKEHIETLRKTKKFPDFEAG